jgi:hypothetical protein
MALRGVTSIPTLTNSLDRTVAVFCLVFLHLSQSQLFLLPSPPIPMFCSNLYLAWLLAVGEETHLSGHGKWYSGNKLQYRADDI